MFDKDLETVENSSVLRIFEIVIRRPVYSLVGQINALSGMSKSADIKPLVRLLKFLPSDDVTLMVLKGHLLIEEQLVSILKTRIGHSKTLEEARLTFFQRLCLAKAVGYRKENDWLWHSIRRLNSVRNDLAHKVDPAKLNVKLQEFIELVENSGLKTPQGSIQSRLKACFLFLCGALQSVAKKKKDG